MTALQSRVAEWPVMSSPVAGRAGRLAADAESGHEPAAPLMQRARGKAIVGFRAGATGGTRAVELFQQGCLKVRLLRPTNAGEAELVVINTAGGLTGGDHVSIAVTAQAGAHVTVTTPACERIYRSAGGEVVIEQQLRVGPGARLDWLPQETILYDRSRVRRRLDVQLQADAEITIVETVLLGRTAMGERLTHGCFADFWTVHRDQRLVFADATRIGPDPGPAIAGPATLGGHLAMTSLVHVGPELASKCDALRAAFAAHADIHAGASVVGEVLVARLVAPGGRELRRVLLAALQCLRHPRAMPRLWFC